MGVWACHYFARLKPGEVKVIRLDLEGWRSG
jgi:hypothetical protein